MKKAVYRERIGGIKGDIPGKMPNHVSMWSPCSQRSWRVFKSFVVGIGIPKYLIKGRKSVVWNFEDIRIDDLQYSGTKGNGS